MGKGYFLFLFSLFGVVEGADYKTFSLFFNIWISCIPVPWCYLLC
uniref:Uncharacterized protein n=1 Tax=Rhizophora mucronata TaxID=61149 RepID=A0A2P2LLW0_RHIMU